MEKLFDTLNSEEKADNPFNTAEESAAFNKLYTRYISLLAESDNKISAENDAFYALNDFVYVERRTAFAVGFRAAMELVFDGRKGENT